MKTFWVVLITVIITGGIIGAGGYFYLNSKSVKEKNDLQSQIDDLNAKISAVPEDLFNDISGSASDSATDSTAITLSWKTYASVKYSYSIKYPANWFLYGGDSSLNIQETEDKSTPDSVPGQYSNAFEVSVKPTTPSETINDAVNERIKEINSKDIGFYQRPETIGGQSGIELIPICDGLGCGNPDWLVIENGNLFTFESNLGYTKTFDTILATFQFTK
jgi:hypothetical protein